MNRNIPWIVLGVVAVIALIVWVSSATYDMPFNSATSTPVATTSVGASGGANGATSGGTNSPTRTSVTLALGAEGGANDVIIKPTSVVEDSRCPAGVQCVQAGTVKVNVNITSGGGTYSRTVELGKTEDLIGGKKLTLTAVAPAAIAGGKPADHTYVLTFSVTG